MAKNTLRIKLVHSTIGEKPKTVGAVRSLGLFWAVVNEPPPGTLGRQS